MADASTEAHSGAMIALVPTEADRKRLAVTGGEPAAELHLTLCFLGGDASVFTPDQVQRTIGAAHLLAADLEPITADITGVAHWNGHADTAAWVWNVSDGQHDRMTADGPCLHTYHEAAETIAMVADCEPPDQYCPWSPHICAAYSKDLTMVRLLEKRLGPVTFDRLWLAIGEHDVYVPLGGALTAAGAVTHRQPTKAEQACAVDFALIDRNWKAAVNGAVDALASQLYAWRYHLREQVVAQFASGDPDLSRVTLDTAEASATLYGLMTQMAVTAGRQAQREAEAQGVTVPDWNLDDEALVAALTGRGFLHRAAGLSVSQLADRLIQSTKARAMRLLGSRRSPDQVGDSISRDLAAQSPARTREVISTAMTAAQNTGRMAVFSKAPPGLYLASEALDKNTCKPCIAIDGTEFTSLAAARAAYPNGGYANCAGGGRCRGTLLADYTRSTDITASATTLEGGTVPYEIRDDHPGCSGYAVVKQSTGKSMGCHKTKSDAQDQIGALYANEPEASAVSTETEELARGVPSKGTKKDKRLKENDYEGQTADHAPDTEDLAKSGLCGPGMKMGPGGKCVSAKPHAAGEAEAMAKGDCPPGMKMGPEGKCMEMGQMAAEEPSVEVSGQTAPWRGPLTVEGIETGDGREFDSGALTWADLPLPLRWNIEDSHGGEARTKAVNVGRIDKVWREDSGLIMGEGVLDLGDENGQKAYSKIEGKFLRGVSVDVDSIKDADMELVWPAQPEDAEGEADAFDQRFAKPEKVVFHKGRIRAATLVDIPAFAEAYIALLDGEGAVVAGGEPIGALRASRAPQAFTADVKVPTRAPAAWFQDPDLSVPTPITITEEGRVYGHAALWGTCHIGQAGMCVTPPREESHPYFMTGDVWTDDGTSVSVGQITVGTGHAGLSLNARQASEHYDNTGAAVADIAVGNDSHGIWVAGAVRPGVDGSRVHELRAAGQVSGDWRRIGGALRLVGLLAVNVPGFPVPKLRTHYAGGSQLALVASGIPHLGEQLTEAELDQWAYRRVLEILSRDVHGKE